MNMPGFDAESSLDKAIGRYRGNIASGRLGTVQSGSRLPVVEAMDQAQARGLGGFPPVAEGGAFTIAPALERHQQCQTIYSGYVTYPMRVCRPPDVLPGGHPGFLDPGSSALGTISRQVRSSPVPAIGQVQVELQSRFCRTLHGPWFALVVQQESCDFRQPDDFKLTISGAPQPVELRWKGTLENAPAAVGAVGNLSASISTCTCCGRRKQCPDGSCVPFSSPCEQTTPA
jgi:hypothetical protein